MQLENLTFEQSQEGRINLFEYLFTPPQTLVEPAYELEIYFKRISRVLDLHLGAVPKNNIFGVADLQYSFGYEYVDSRRWRSRNALSARLEYVLELREKELRAMSVACAYFDTNEERALRVYDDLMAMPELTFSEQSQAECAAIKTYRQGIAPRRNRGWLQTLRGR